MLLLPLLLLFAIGADAQEGAGGGRRRRLLLSLIEGVACLYVRVCRIGLDQCVLLVGVIDDGKRRRLGAAWIASHHRGPLQPARESMTHASDPKRKKRRSRRTHP